MLVHTYLHLILILAFVYKLQVAPKCIELTRLQERRDDRDLPRLGHPLLPVPDEEECHHGSSGLAYPRIYVSIIINYL
jgi:hypothetical protein